MKKLFVLVAVAGLFLAVTKPVGAVFETGCCKIDCEKFGRLPNTAACYESGTHGIPGEAEEHVGADWVKIFLDGKILYQFFCGTSPSEGLHRTISIWKAAKDSCPSGWLRFEEPYPEWGDYLIPGADYCIKTIVLPCPTCVKDKP